MQKFIRIMAIVAVCLVGLSLFLLLLTIPFQRMIAMGIYDYPYDVVGILPRFPLLPFVFGCLRLGCMVLLIICCGNKKGGIWLELIVFACLMLVIPGISRIVTPIYTQMATRMGSTYIVANNIVSSIANTCMIPGGWGQAIAYAVCGMSIVFKKMSKPDEV